MCIVYYIQALQQQYPLSTIDYSSPFKFKDPQGSLKIVVERSSENYKIAIQPSNAEVIFIVKFQ